jgi:hypothetical protein
MNVESDDPNGAASGTVHFSRRRIALVRELEREEQGIVASGTAEV